MYLKNSVNHQLVEVLSLIELFDPSHNELEGRYHAGEELQDPESFLKSDLTFLSGEKLPLCWTDSHYRDDHVRH